MEASYFDGASAIVPVLRGRLRRQYVKQLSSRFTGLWVEINPLNVPGPFYGAGTDTTEEGPDLAPACVSVDAIGQAFVWRQPRDIGETFSLVTAASSDPFAGYSADGDAHWTPALVEQWWDDRHTRVASLEALARAMRSEIAAEFLTYVTMDVERDLNRYTAFLESSAVMRS